MKEDNKEIWFGITVILSVSLKNLKVLYGEDSIVVLSKRFSTLEDYIDFFGCLTHTHKLFKNLKDTYGIFLGSTSDVIRRKLKTDFLKNLNEKNILFLFESANEDAYYTYKVETNEFLGIELRGNLENLKERDVGSEIIGILKAISDQRKKL